MDAITSSNPTTIPAAPEKVFDRWRVVGLHAEWPDPNSDMNIHVGWAKYRRDEAGVGEDANVRAEHHVNSVFALAATNPTVAAALDALLVAMEQVSRDAGVIN